MLLENDTWREIWATPLLALCERNPLPSFAVGYPDIFHLIGVLEVPAPFRLLRAEEIQLPPLIGPDLFQVSGGKSFGGRTQCLVSIAPDGVQVVVFRHDLQQFPHAPGNQIHRATRKIAGLENLVQVTRDQWIG